MVYYFRYKFTKDEIEALKKLEETLPGSLGQEVIQDIISQPKKERLAEIIKDLEGKIQCNCDLDTWEPEKTTGHTHVCLIHKLALVKSEG